MDATRRVVYLEDLEKPAPSAASAAVKENVSATAAETSKSSEAIEEEKAGKATTTATEKKTATGATKRQQSLTDMFTKKSSSSSSSRLGPALKKSKTDNPSLNSIPFSLKEYQDTLSEEEKRLLTLECETMGKSWSVPIIVPRQDPY